MDNEEIILGSIVIILIVVGIIYFSLDLFKSDNSFEESSPPQTRFLDLGDERIVDDPRYLNFDDPRNSICPDGYYIYGLTTGNRILCNNKFGEFIDTNIFISGVADCPADQYLYGFNSNGTIDCRVDQQGSGTDTNCSVSGSCNLIPYKDIDETIDGDANWTFTNPLRVGSLFPYNSGNTLGSSLGRQWNQLYISENGITMFNCQVGGCSDETGYFYLEPNAGDDQNNFFIDFSAFKNIINVVSDPYKLMLYDADYSPRFYVDANGNAWFDGNVLIDLNLFVDGNITAECYLFKDGSKLCGVPTYSDTNVWSENFLDDQNAFVNDINGGGNNLFNVIDVNAENLYIKTPDLNFFVYDKNIVMQTANGMVIVYPDQNKLCVGSDPNARACQWVSCSGGDCNAFFGFG